MSDEALQSDEALCDFLLALCDFLLALRDFLLALCDFMLESGHLERCDILHEHCYLTALTY
jgi:hypothetical protein